MHFKFTCELRKKDRVSIIKKKKKITPQLNQVLSFITFNCIAFFKNIFFSFYFLKNKICLTHRGKMLTEKLYLFIFHNNIRQEQ